jgi:hypothetical protein
MKTGCYDKNGIEIETGQDVLVIDKNYNAWRGSIGYRSGRIRISEEKFLENYFVFMSRSKTIILNNDWTKKSLEIILKKETMNKFKFIERSIV